MEQGKAFKEHYDKAFLTSQIFPFVFISMLLNYTHAFIKVTQKLALHVKRNIVEPNGKLSTSGELYFLIVKFSGTYSVPLCKISPPLLRLRTFPEPIKITLSMLLFKVLTNFKMK